MTVDVRPRSEGIVVPWAWPGKTFVAYFGTTCLLPGDHARPVALSRSRQRSRRVQERRAHFRAWRSCATHRVAGLRAAREGRASVGATAARTSCPASRTRPPERHLRMLRLHRGSRGVGWRSGTSIPVLLVLLVEGGTGRMARLLRVLGSGTRGARVWLGLLSTVGSRGLSSTGDGGRVARWRSLDG